MLMCFRAKNQGVDVETLVYELPADAKREEAHIPWTVKRAAMQRAQAARKHVATARAKASSGDLQAESASPANVETPLVAPDMNLPTYAQLRTMSDQDIFDSVMNDQEFAVQQCMTDLGPNMRRVQVTTLVLQAEDDPIVSEKHVDWNKLSANKNIITMHTNRGGHVAWYEGFGPGGTTWNDRVAMRFISACLESHCQTNFMLNVFRTFLNNSALTDGPDVSQARPAASTKFPSAQSHQASPTSMAAVVEAAMSSYDVQADSQAQNHRRHQRTIPPSQLARICSVSDLAVAGGGAVVP
eukprot:INCI4112.3.p2 GENE.INCI4112.3~~INCI4112.3.p2  ORF type:complete len:298 (+),score=49.56 INCI4112.3:1387-2280(+)